MTLLECAASATISSFPIIMFLQRTCDATFPSRSLPFPLLPNLKQLSPHDKSPPRREHPLRHPFFFQRPEGVCARNREKGCRTTSWYNDLKKEGKERELKSSASAERERFIRKEQEGMGGTELSQALSAKVEAHKVKTVALLGYRERGGAGHCLLILQIDLPAS